MYHNAPTHDWANTRVHCQIDFLNATNNTVSGFLVVSRRHDLNPGPGCQLNGWIGQFSVQVRFTRVLHNGPPFSLRIT